MGEEGSLQVLGTLSGPNAPLPSPGTVSGCMHPQPVSNSQSHLPQLSACLVRNTSANIQ